MAATCEGTQLIGPASQADMDSNIKEFQKLIGRFFFEAGIDFECLSSPSFLNMVTMASGQGQGGNRIPNCQDLRGWILDEVLQEMKQYIEEIRQSWATTGCSILLDEWTNKKGQIFVNFLVDCPRGLVYLQSSNISNFGEDINALHSLFDGVIREVGEDNVVQVIANSTTRWTRAFREQFQSRHKNVYWSVGASHCIELILDKIGKTLPFIKNTLTKAKSITKFIHGNQAILELYRENAKDHGLIKPSKFKSAMPYLTLENMLLNGHKIRKMFVSPRWCYSRWSSTVEAKRVGNLVLSQSFWKGASMTVKATIPLVNALRLIIKAENPLVGYIYDTIDQVKETIRDFGFRNNESKYKPIWDVIDDIWDSHLHCHLHAAGCYLNPSYFYARDLCCDVEVMSGQRSCVSRLVRDPDIEKLIIEELKKYEQKQGDFKEGSVVKERNGTSPGEILLDIFFPFKPYLDINCMSFFSFLK